jgi:hypothetical protein
MRARPLPTEKLRLTPVPLRARVAAGPKSFSMSAVIVESS